VREQADQVLVFEPFGRVARDFDLAGINITVGASFLRVFCEGRESEMPAPSGFDHVSTTKSNGTRSIAGEAKLPGRFVEFRFGRSSM
jgi:hypothetical protein